MRPVSLAYGISIEDVFQALRAIEQASREEDVCEMARGFTLGTFTPTLSLDPATATAADVANVVCTFLDMLQRGGTNRLE